MIIFTINNRDFENHVSESNNTNPMDTQLRVIAPLIDRRLNTIQNQMTSLDNRFNSLDNRIDGMETMIGDITAGRAPLNIHLSIASGNNDETPVVTTTVVPTSITSVQPDPNTAATDSRHATTLAYRLSRGVKSIPELWREWHSGLGGGPSVLDLERLEPGWYSGDKSFFNRRRRIVNAIKKYAHENGLTEETSMLLAEERRIRYKKTLDFLGKNQRTIFE